MKKVMVFFTNAEGHEIYHVPEYKTEWASGADLKANHNEVIKPGEIKLIHTGISVAVPEGYEMQIRPRSGLALKNGISLVNTPGTVDCFSKDCCIKTIEGDKTIEELKINDVVFSFNEEKNIIEKDLIKAIINTGEQEVLIIETEEGNIEITQGTLIYTKNKGLIKANLLEEGDEIVSF